MSSMKTEIQTMQKAIKISEILKNESKVDTDENEDYITMEQPYKMQIVWFNAIGFLILHVAAVYGFYLMVTSAMVLTNIWAICTVHLSGLAITMGAHRLFTHRSFKTNKWIRLALVTFQTVAGQNCLWVWIRDHRQHHKYSETSVPCLLWGETLWNSFFISIVSRLVVSLNGTWLVNSAAHIYGTRPFTKDIAPAENWFVSFFALGEGWHNYHHTFPWDYRAAEYGQHFNVTTTVIDYCAKKGWVYDVKCASWELVKKHSTKKGDGTHLMYGKFTSDDWVTNTDNAY